jgi:hypothetical protein
MIVNRWGSDVEPQPGLAPESALGLLPSRGLSSAPAVGSVSARADYCNGSSKKRLDVRSAFRHVATKRGGHRRWFKTPADP